MKSQDTTEGRPRLSLWRGNVPPPPYSLHGTGKTEEPLISLYLQLRRNGVLVCFWQKLVQNTDLFM